MITSDEVGNRLHDRDGGAAKTPAHGRDFWPPTPKIRHDSCSTLVQ
jgi:hypothetical protein